MLVARSLFVYCEYCVYFDCVVSSQESPLSGKKEKIMALRKQEPIDNEAELRALRDLEFALRDPENNPPKLVTAYGAAFEIPESVIRGLTQMVHYLSYG